LVAESDEISLCFLPDIVVALEKWLILSALDSCLRMLMRRVSWLYKLGWDLLIEGFEVNVAMLVLHKVLWTNWMLWHRYDWVSLCWRTMLGYLRVLWRLTTFVEAVLSCSSSALTAPWFCTVYLIWIDSNVVVSHYTRFRRWCGLWLGVFLFVPTPSNWFLPDLFRLNEQVIILFHELIIFKCLTSL
jgi:hypothetical protein